MSDAIRAQAGSKKRCPAMTQQSGQRDMLHEPDIGGKGRADGIAEAAILAGHLIGRHLAAHHLCAIAGRGHALRHDHHVGHIVVAASDRCRPGRDRPHQENS